MQRTILSITFAVLFSGSFMLAVPAFAINESQIKSKIIAKSISQYSGNCPCPYNTDRAGRSCGRRSAYSRAGGYSPLCYPRDVTDKMVKEYVKNTN